MNVSWQQFTGYKSVWVLLNTRRACMSSSPCGAYLTGPSWGLIMCPLRINIIMSCIGWWTLDSPVIRHVFAKGPDCPVLVSYHMWFCQKLLKNVKNWKSVILVLPDVDFHKNSQIFAIWLLFLAFLSNFWQNHIWKLTKTGQFQPLAGACLPVINHYKAQFIHVIFVTIFSITL